jgi:predicted nucleic acid-binding Zn ribbon protein
MQKISDAKLKKCPSCGKNALKKLISAPVFRLKGSGWYETDFKGDQEQKRNLAGADKEAAGDSKEAKDPTAAVATDSTDSKAAAASDAKGDSKGDSKGDAAADKPSAKADAKTPKVESARSKQTGRKASPAKSAPKPAPRAKAKPKPRAAKRRGRR